MITLFSVLLATAVPRLLEPLVSSGEGIAAVLLSFFFAAVGESDNTHLVCQFAGPGSSGTSVLEPQFPPGNRRLPAPCKCITKPDRTSQAPEGSPWLVALIRASDTVHRYSKIPWHCCVSNPNQYLTGANGDIRMVVKGAPSLFAFCLVQIAVHLGSIMAAGKLMDFSRRDVLIASNANVGGESRT